MATARSAWSFRARPPILKSYNKNPIIKKKNRNSSFPP